MIRAISNVLLIAAAIVAVPAHSAGYLKLGDIKGESAKPGHAIPGNRVMSNDAPKPAGMLVPAVQKARTDVPKSPDGAKKKGNVEYSWKVEEGVK